MKTSFAMRIIGLIAAASTTFALFQSVALIGRPALPAAVVVAAAAVAAPR